MLICSDLHFGTLEPEAVAAFLDEAERDIDKLVVSDVYSFCFVLKMCLFPIFLILLFFFFF